MYRITVSIMLCHSMGEGSTPSMSAKLIYNHLKRLHTVVESTPLYEMLTLAIKPPINGKGIVKTGMYTVNPNKRMPVGEKEKRDGYYMCCIRTVAVPLPSKQKTSVQIRHTAPNIAG